MSDIDDDYDDDDDGSPVDVDALRKLEVDILSALQNDASALFEFPVTVTSYLAVAEVIKPTGALDMFWTVPEDMPPQAMLGLAHWLLKRVDEAT